MSLYGPRIRLPKVDGPIPGNPSWNLEKEKKLALYIVAAIIVIILAIILVPMIFRSLGEATTNVLNPAISVSWQNNPLDLSKDQKDAQLFITITNTEKTTQDISFNLSTESKEIIIFCPNSIYDPAKRAYVLQSVSPGDNRKIPCIVRRDTEFPIFTGQYTISISTSLGETKTTLDVVSK